LPSNGCGPRPCVISTTDLSRAANAANVPSNSSLFVGIAQRAALRLNYCRGSHACAAVRRRCGWRTSIDRDQAENGDRPARYLRCRLGARNLKASTECGGRRHPPVFDAIGNGDEAMKAYTTKGARGLAGLLMIVLPSLALAGSSIANSQFRQWKTRWASWVSPEAS